MKLFFAPLQGYTDAAYRKFHNEIYESCIDCYFTPFIRVENGEPRQKDIRDINLERNNLSKTIPQIIVKNIDEFNILVNAIQNEGYSRIDINMGCPFPLQVKRGRGAALLSSINNVKEIMHEVEKIKNVKFSVKMRLGQTENNQWRQILPILNDTPLEYITLHPRIATQQYNGSVDIEAFNEVYINSKHNLIFNGDIINTDQLLSLEKQYAGLYGVMMGRGLLSSPSLAWEYVNKINLSQNEKLDKFILFHNKLFEFYESKLQGDSQLLSKVKTLWDYSETMIGRKLYKQIKKTTTLSKYQQLISMLSKI